MRIAWATDVHLNFVVEPAVAAFGRALAEAGPDGAILSGDVSEAPSLARHLDLVGQALGRPPYLVLGNHDFYHGSVARVRADVAVLSDEARVLWLAARPPQPLAAGACVTGCDGWGDARLGTPDPTRVPLSDFFYIDDLVGRPRPDLVDTLRRMGDAEAAVARTQLAAALASYREVLFVTHVPPFREACWHDGRVSGDDWLPFFTCDAVGRALLEAADAHPHARITVLCGHTHSAGVTRLRDNLVVYTGGAEYGAPQVSGVVEVDERGAITVHPRASR